MPRGNWTTGNWYRATVTGQRTYEGKPCGKCGRTKRLTKNSDCARCHNRGRRGALVRGARSRARSKGLDFDLTSDVLAGAEGRPCPACDTPMRRKTRHAPSLDRVLNEDGYVASNVHVICRRCNMRKGDMSAAELQRLADWARTAEAQVDFCEPVL